MTERARLDDMPVTIRGVEFPTAQAAADAFGLHTKTIINAARKGRLDYVGIPAHLTRKRSGVEAKPVRVRGAIFKTARQAAQALKVSPITIRGAIWPVARTSWASAAAAATTAAASVSCPRTPSPFRSAITRGHR